MPTLLAPPRIVAVDGNGLAMSGALLYFYESGTSTPKDTYADAGLTTPNENPVEADANGLFPSIYLGSGDYKVIFKTAADVTVYTVDPQPGLGAADSLTTRGDLLTRDASGYVRLPIGPTGHVLTSNGTDPVWQAPAGLPRALIEGLTYANNGDDPTNDINIAVGSAMDGTNTRMLVLGTAMRKRLDAAWAAGGNQGALDTGSVADADYFIWLIHRSDTGASDVLFSLSATAPTMPANYNFKRLIGWFKREGGAISAFATYETAGGGIDFYWKVPTLDVNLVDTLTTSGRTDAIRVPLAFSTVAHISVEVSDAASAFLAWIYNPDQTSAAPASDAAPLANIGIVTSGGLYNYGPMNIRTSADGKIGARANIATVDLYNVSTMGFTWSRR